MTAPLVYANYGRPEDFDALEAAGVSAEGTIVITRYGEESHGFGGGGGLVRLFPCHCHSVDTYSCCCCCRRHVYNRSDLFLQYLHPSALFRHLTRSTHVVVAD